MSLVSTFQHAYAIAISDIVKTSKFVETKVVPFLQQAQTQAATIEAVTSLVSPQAANIERVAFAVLGVVTKAVEDSIVAGKASGVNIELDEAVLADIKAILPTIKAQSAVTTASVAK